MKYSTICLICWGMLICVSIFFLAIGDTANGDFHLTQFYTFMCGYVICLCIENVR